MACNSSIFNAMDSLKSPFHKESISLCRGLKTFEPYIGASKKTLIVFCDAKSLLYIGRRKEFDILSFHLANFFTYFLSNYGFNIYHISGKYNILADLFSRAFSRSRFCNNDLTMSKKQAENLPPLTDPFVLESETLFHFLSTEVRPESGDTHDKSRRQLAIPRPLTKFAKLFQDSTPEEKYFSAIRLLKGHDDESLKKLNLDSQVVKQRMNSILSFIKPPRKFKNTFIHPEHEEPGASTGDFVQFLKNYKTPQNSRPFINDSIKYLLRQGKGELISKLSVAVAERDLEKIRKVLYSGRKVIILRESPYLNQNGEVISMAAPANSLVEEHSYYYPFQKPLRFKSNVHFTFKSLIHGLHVNTLFDPKGARLELTSTEVDIALPRQSPYAKISCPEDALLIIAPKVLFDVIPDMDHFLPLGVKVSTIDTSNDPERDPAPNVLPTDPLPSGDFVLPPPTRLPCTTMIQSAVEKLSKEPYSIMNVQFNETDKKALISEEMMSFNNISEDVFSTLQFNDPFCAPKLQSAETPGFRVHKKKLLYKIGASPSDIDKLVIPGIMVDDLVAHLHAEHGHPSKNSLEKVFFARYYHPDVRKKISKLYDQCIVCAKVRPKMQLHYSSGTSRTFEPRTPREGIYLDVIPNLPPSGEKKEAFTCFLLIADAFSKYLSAIPMKDKSAESIKGALQNYFNVQGLPRFIHADSEASIVKAVTELQEFFPGLAFKTSAGGSQNRNAVEASWRTLKESIRNFIYEPKHELQMSDWPIALTMALHSINKIPLEKIGLSREVLHYASDNTYYPFSYLEPEVFNVTDIDVALKAYAAKREKDYRGKKHKSFKVGQIVYSSLKPNINSSFFTRNQGPFKILSLDDNLRTATLNKLGSQSIFKIAYNNLSNCPLKDVVIPFSKKWDQKIINLHSRPRICRLMPEIFEKLDVQIKEQKSKNEPNTAVSGKNERLLVENESSPATLLHPNQEFDQHFEISEGLIQPTPDQEPSPHEDLPPSDLGIGEPPPINSQGSTSQDMELPPPPDTEPPTPSSHDMEFSTSSDTFSLSPKTNFPNSDSSMSPASNVPLPPPKPPPPLDHDKDIEDDSGLMTNQTPPPPSPSSSISEPLTPPPPVLQEQSVGKIDKKEQEDSSSTARGILTRSTNRDQAGPKLKVSFDKNPPMIKNIDNLHTSTNNVTSKDDDTEFITTLNTITNIILSITGCDF